MKPGRECEWRPIETAPKDGTEIIVGWDQATVWIVRSARFVRGDDWVPPDLDAGDGWWSYRNSVAQEMVDPTHWLMEVPPERNYDPPPPQPTPEEREP